MELSHGRNFWNRVFPAFRDPAVCEGEPIGSEDHMKERVVRRLANTGTRCGRSVGETDRD